MEAVEKEVGRLEAKQHSTVTAALSRVDALLGMCGQAMEQMAGEGGADGTGDAMHVESSAAGTGAGSAGARGGPTAEEALLQLAMNVKKYEAAKKVAKDRRDYHAALSKLGKAIDKTFQDSEPPKLPIASAVDQSLLDEVLAEEFMRSGNTELAATFMDESGVQLSEQRTAVLRTLNRLTHAFRDRDLAFLAQWAAEHPKHFSENMAAVKFDLCRLEFVELLSKGDKSAVLAFAQKHFARAEFRPFFDQIKPLMGALVWMERPETSPYSFVRSGELWSAAQERYVHAVCDTLNVPALSPLFVVLTASSLALPRLLKFASLSSNTWNGDSSLPVELPTGDAFQYHSVFTCPVSKEQASASNPPVRLKCGHVLCKQSMEGLRRSAHGRFKCPYCPAEMRTAHTQQLSIH